MPPETVTSPTWFPKGDDIREIERQSDPSKPDTALGPIPDPLGYTPNLETSARAIDISQQSCGRTVFPHIV
ncbi:hypothetical protein PHLCEN_2v575 [Hermanssonia centrifuga]|uniref:Uncharacterized protein n=1 Tax=Hermanssonia centrifuga TaxID=98765 RepID=A0A2R6S5R6_9APHY|nr:hypothetical protein PHLCEN_2v575 [Hermanssonia centrifuga]